MSAIAHNRSFFALFKHVEHFGPFLPIGPPYTAMLVFPNLAAATFVFEKILLQREL